MSGSAIQKYLLPGLETGAGIGSQFIAPGNPIGLGLAGSGIGQLAGGAMGGPMGQQMGAGLGGLAGGAAGGALGSMGPAGIPGLSSALSSNPALAGITPSMVTGMGPTGSMGATGAAMPEPSMGGAAPGGMAPGGMGPMGAGQPQNSTLNNALAAAGPMGQAYMQYLQQMQMQKLRNSVAYAPPHNSPGQAVSPLSFQPGVGISLPGQY